MMLDLLSPIIWSIAVALTLRPPLRDGRFGFLIYVLTMMINELPLLFLLLVLATIAAGRIDPPTGVVGLIWLALWCFVVGGLVWAQIRAGRSRPALEAALATSLGAGWRASIDPALAPDLSTRTPWLAGIVRPFQRQLPTVERTRNLAYGPDPAHRLDLYLGPTRPLLRPILIHFHEGGFVQGRKSRESVHLLNQLAFHGWLCLSANYRLRAQASFPNPLVDAKRVIAWARAHAAEYGADPDQVFLIGGSAGGHLALNAALTPNQVRFQPEFADADTSVSAAVSVYGYLGARAADPGSSPADLAGSQSPALLLVQGANDTVLPSGGPRSWAESLRCASGAPVVYAELPGAQHGFDLVASVRARVAANAIEAFLAWVRSSVQVRS